MFVFTANNPEELRREIVKFLQSEADHQTSQVNTTASKRKVMDIQAATAALTAAGRLIEGAKIEAPEPPQVDKFTETYRKAASEQWATDECEIDAGAKVSVSDDGGAWVGALVWVSDADAGICTECRENLSVTDDGKCSACDEKEENGRPAGYVVDVPVTLSVAVRGVTSKEKAFEEARAFAYSLAPTQPFIDGYSETLEKVSGVTITEVSLESSSEDTCEVLEELEAE